jgi:hypothetical protein
MAHAYTPGLRISADTIIRKRRVLPIPGEVLVAQGEHVTATTHVAQTALPGTVYPINVVNKLSISPSEIHSYLLKQEGDTIEKGEVLAENKPLIKWFQTQVRAPVSGTIETISKVTGQVFLREPPEVIRLSAYIDGTIVEVTPQQGVVVESHCTFVQGIFGLGGETAGPITQAVLTPDEILTPQHLRRGHAGQIVVGGALAQKETFVKARELGVRALVVGGVHDQDLKELLGYDLGVAITGTEQIGFSLLVTEGFGHIPMAKRTFDLLTAKAGKHASCNGAPQIRAGVIRPEVIIPLNDEEEDTFEVQGSKFLVQDEVETHGIQIGDIVRIIREPNFGLLARVQALPAELQQTATESRVRVLVATLPNGQNVTIPRMNVEMIEE